MSIEAIKKALEGVDRTLWDQSFDGVGVIVSINGQVGRDVHALKRNSDYVKAASPAAISDIISEIDRFQRENASLREIISKSAEALGTGAFVHPSCSVEFMSGLPKEVRSTVATLRSSALASTGGEHHANK